MSASSSNISSFTTEFAVEMTCQSCVNTVESALKTLKGIQESEINLAEKRVIVHGTTPPSLVFATLKDTGLNVIVRGQGSKFHLGAGVCIFEHFPEYQGGWAQYNNRGLARLIQVDEQVLLLDLSLHGVQPNTKYYIWLNESGDISQGVESTGEAVELLGQVESDSESKATMITEIHQVKIWDMMGRALVVDKVSPPSKQAICGIVARSAGLFENTKQVCACSGKTLWNESNL